MVRYHYYVSGEVQGVGFRYKAQRIASRLQLTGWVRNLSDGRVELELQGEQLDIERFFPWMEDSCYIEIAKIEAKELPTVDNEASFGVRYSV
ncbi:MAG: acylphosphatase [Proteobacteria bacterium]|nr:acylphosphatase [Pseudomonadota bacterium]